MGACWICKRSLPVQYLTFIKVEDDGCREYECTDRRDCIMFTLVNA